MRTRRTRFQLALSAVTAILSVASAVAVALAPGGGAPEARIVLEAGFTALALLMGFMAWQAWRRRD